MTGMQSGRYGQRRLSSLTVDAFARAEYDGDGDKLGRNGNDTVTRAILITELKLSGGILRNVSESVYDSQNK